MKLYEVTARGHWLSFHAVVVAECSELALHMLHDELKQQGLEKENCEQPYSSISIKELDLTTPAIHVLFNGDY